MNTLKRIAVAFQVECLKQARLSVLLAGPLFMAVAVLAVSLRYPMDASTSIRHQYLADSLPLVINLLGFALMLLFASNQIAGERAQGTLRQLLLRPIGRLEWLAAKYLTTLAYGLWLISVTTLVAVARAALGGPLSGIAFGGEVLFTESDMVVSLLLGLLLGFLPAAAGAAVALAASTYARTTASAMGIVLGGWLALDVVKYPLGIDRYVVTTYLDSGWRVFASRCEGYDLSWSPHAEWAVGVSAVTSAVALLLAAWRMRSMNVTRA